MEQPWILDTTDGFKIHGLLNPAKSGESDKALLIIHGMTGAPEELQHTAAAQFFSEKGYDVIRPYLYSMDGSKEKARSFQDATIATHARDINTIVQHFAPQYKTLYAAGHSYGGPSILTSDTTPFLAISLWDPSFKKERQLSSSFVKDDETGQYVIEWDHSIPVGQAMLDESMTLDRAHCIALAEKCKAPLQVIYAGDGDYYKAGESYNDFVKTAHDMKVVPGTEHCFIESGTTEPLLQYTYDWFSKFQP